MGGVGVGTRIQMKKKRPIPVPIRAIAIQKLQKQLAQQDQRFDSISSHQSNHCSVHSKIIIIKPFNIAEPLNTL